jgi:hypothetical protein
VIVPAVSAENIETSTERIVRCLEARGVIRRDEIVSQKRRKTIAVDFDGVLAEYEGWRGENVLGKPRQVVSLLCLLREEGWKVIVHTTRPTRVISEYLSSWSIAVDEINQNSDCSNCGHKPVATVYWDDRAICYSGNAFFDLATIRNFRTWNQRL